MDNYLIVKALHIISIIAWMAGLLYLPRLYVYHTTAEIGSELDATLQIMERRLLRFIMNPAMIVSFVLGLYLTKIIGGMEGIGGWYHAKMTLVLLLAGCHGMMAKFRKDFALGINKKSTKFFRVFNEVPTILMIGIVFLVVVKPF